MVAMGDVYTLFVQFILSLFIQHQKGQAEWEEFEPGRDRVIWYCRNIRWSQKVNDIVIVNGDNSSSGW